MHHCKHGFWFRMYNFSYTWKYIICNSDWKTYHSFHVWKTVIVHCSPHWLELMCIWTFMTTLFSMWVYNKSLIVVSVYPLLFCISSNTNKCRALVCYCFDSDFSFQMFIIKTLITNKATSLDCQYLKWSTCLHVWEEKITGTHIIDVQGCALVVPGGPSCPTFAVGWLENLSFFIEILCWHLDLHRFTK